LKGWWAPGPDGNVWLPLISQVLKLGKTMRHPDQIYKKEGLGGYYSHAHAVARTLQNVPRNYPILGGMLASYDELGLGYLGQHRDLCDGVFENPYKTKIDSFRDFDEEAVMAMIGERYGLGSCEIKEIDSMFRNIKQLPAFVSHPEILTIRDVDYGAGGLCSA